MAILVTVTAGKSDRRRVEIENTNAEKSISMSWREMEGLHRELAQLLDPKTEPTTCPECNGSRSITCPTCDGTGGPPDDACCACGGNGELPCPRCSDKRSPAATAKSSPAPSATAEPAEAVHLPWGVARVTEVVNIAWTHHAPSIELLEFKNRKKAIRFAAFHEGDLVPGPLVLDADAIPHLASALAGTKIQRLLVPLATATPPED